MDHQSQSGSMLKTIWETLPKRPVTLFLVMLIIGVSAFFIDTLSENRILGVFIPAAFTQDKVQIYNNSQNNSLLGLGEMMETKTYHTTFSTQATSASTSLLMTTLISSTTTTTLSTSVTLISPQAAIEVHCSPSPYVDCDGSLMDESTTNETFGVVLLRRPGWMDISRFDFSKCQYSKCVFQGDTIDNTTRLIIIYTVGLNDNFKLSQRWPGQIYAAATWESPPHTHASFLSDKNSYWNFVFNVTATYRTDSEIFVPYARLIFQPTPKGKRPNYLEIAQKKTKWIAWFVSNCRTPSRRHEYVQQMQKVIDVDIYGGCGKPCSQGGSVCTEDFPAQYRFYLSFENSLCTDYITEKFFKLFTPNAHVIPVVRGGLDYNKHLPNYTFINASDFKSANDLAQFLKQLGNDPAAFSRYLEHKDMYRMKEKSGIDNIGCKSCQYLHTRKQDHEAKVYDMKDWMGDNRCYEANDL